MKKLHITVVTVVFIAIFISSLIPECLADGHFTHENGILEYYLDNESIAINLEDLKEWMPEFFYIPWFDSPYGVAFSFNHVGLLPGYSDLEDYLTLVEESKYAEMETMSWPRYTSEKGTIAKILGMDFIGFDLSFFPSKETNIPELIFTDLYFNEDPQTVLSVLEGRYGAFEKESSPFSKNFETEDTWYYFYVGQPDKYDGMYILRDVYPCTVVSFSSSHKDR